MIYRLLFVIAIGVSALEMPAAASTASLARHQFDGQRAIAADVGQIARPSVDQETRARQPDPLNAPCPPGTDKRTSDLCAQWKAADAAASSARWADASFYLAVAGMVVGILTLWIAGLAAYFSKVSAAEARRSADLAFNALKNEYRPRIVPILEFVRDIEVSEHLESTVKVTCTNIGQAVARDLRVVVHAFLLGTHEGAWATTTARFNDAAREGKSPDGESVYGDHTLAYFAWPGMPHEVEWNISIKDSIFKSKKRNPGGIPLNIFVGVWYNGDHGEEYTSSIIFDVRQKSPKAIFPSSLSYSLPTAANDIVLRQFPNAVIT